MKKFLFVILTVLLLLPMTVKADMEQIIPYYNSNVVVGGELEVHIPVTFGKEYDITANFDSKVLKIDANSVTISKPSYQKANDDKCDTFDNVKGVSINDGSVTIKALMYNDFGCVIDGDSRAEINLRFTVIGKGEARVDFVGKEGTLIGPAVANATEIKKEEKETTETNEKVETVGASKNDTTKDIILYSSLGLNALLLVTLPIVAMKKKRVD